MSRQKGVRRERQARELYEQAGYVCASTSTGSRWGDTDLLNLFDAIALHSDRRVAFIQIKSNGTAGDLSEFFEECADVLPDDHAVAQFAVCFDRAGWKLYEENGDGSYQVVVDERNETCGMGEHVIEYLQEKEVDDE